MKIDRLIGIIMLLNNRGRMTAGELAARYEVSIKTIRRDMEAINQSGVPVVAYQGQDGGYEIIKEYRIDRSVLTQVESRWILQLLNGIGKNFPFKEFEGLKEKFGVIDDGKSEDTRIFFDFSPWDSENRTGEKLKLIKEAFITERYLIFQYRNLRGECAERKVEPLRLIFKGVCWYLLGWCTTKKDYRLFRAKRMQNLQLGEIFFEKRESNLETLSDSWTQATEIIRFKIMETFKSKLEDYFDTYQLDGNIVSVSWPVDEWVVGFFIGIGTDIEVMEPISLREKIREEVKKLHILYK